MAKITLVYIIGEVLKALAGFGLATGSICKVSKSLLKMLDFFQQKGSKYFSSTVLDEYWNSLTHRATPYGPVYLSTLRRSIEMVSEYAVTGIITWSCRKRGNKYTPCAYYQSIIDSSLDHLQLNESTLRWYATTARKFCCKLEELHVFDFSTVSPELITIIITGFGKDNSRSMGMVVSNLKKFLVYLNAEKLCNLQISPTLFVKTKRVRHIPAYSIEEIRSIVTACDRKTPQGIRNYAILLLAVTCGLRSSDIQGLKLSDINWHRYEIHIVQRKTNSFIVLPLIGETGNAVANYILSARPQDTTFEHVFLTVNAPHRPLATTAFNAMLLDLCKKASVPKIEGRNFHSLRRSMATWMANSKVPVPTIAQVLGHSNVHSADRYIAADPTMVACSLNFTDIPLTSEVYR